MRCSVCELPHKNTNRHSLWMTERICRVCAFLLEYFGMNGNHLKEYWNE